MKISNRYIIKLSENELTIRKLNEGKFIVILTRENNLQTELNNFIQEN
jgi:hypothetical protein